MKLQLTYNFIYIHKLYRYIQVGNAVAVPVGRALGYSLGLAMRQVPSSKPVMVLPNKFPLSLMKSTQQIHATPIKLEEGV